MAARLRGLMILSRGWVHNHHHHSSYSAQIWVDSNRGDGGARTPRRRGMSSGAAAAAWEECVVVETDHSLAKRVEEAIAEYRIRKAAPDWLPFVPGSSYWMPPDDRFAGAAIEVPLLRLDLTEEQLMAILAPPGWPSSSSRPEKVPSEKQKNKFKKKS